MHVKAKRRTHWKPILKPTFRDTALLKSTHPLLDLLTALSRPSNRCAVSCAQLSPLEKHLDRRNFVELEIMNFSASIEG